MDDGYDAHAVVPTLSGASSLQLAAFFEEERLHVKEGVVVIDEDYSSRKTASISTEGCDAIVHGFEARLDGCRLSLDSCRETNGKPDGGTGGGAGGGGAARARQERQAKAAKAARAKLEKLRLKLSGTTLLQAIDATADPDAAAADATAYQAAVLAQPPAAPEVPESPEAAVAAVAVPNGGDAGGSPTEAVEEAEEAEELVEAAAATHAATTAAAVASAAEEEGEGGEDGAESDLVDVLARAVAGSAAPAGGGAASGVAGGAGDGNEEEVRGYDSELEYLDDQFATLVQRIQVAAEVQKRRVKQAEVEESAAPWEKPTKKVNVSELQAKLRISEAKIALRLQRPGKLGTPRLEGLCAQLQLDAFEKSVLLITCGYTISPVVKQLLAQTSASSHSYDADRLSVGRILQVFTTSFHEQVSRRVYFYKSARLVRRGLVRLVSDRYQNRDDLTDSLVRLDRRVLDCLVGLEDESTEVAESASLYSPSVALEDVVLPDALSTKLLLMLEAHAQLRAYNKRVGLSKAIPQPDGLVLLLCGPSGAGKTMTANAIAHKLGKKMLLVNFPVLARAGGSGAATAASVQSIFREAELANAVVFFDECESLFAKRGHGGSSEMTELLTEIERFDGIIFMATNRPQDLDEAMFRRIRCVFELTSPHHAQRLQIWRRLTSAAGIVLADGVDLAEISLKYEITGGYIRNAVLAALLSAVGRAPRAPRLTQADLHAGCREQMRGALQAAELESRLVPLRSLDQMVVPPPLLASLRSLVALEKARPNPHPRSTPNANPNPYLTPT